MIEYKNELIDSKNELNDLISDYVYLSSLNKNLECTFLFPYYDDTYNFDLIMFYRNLPCNNLISNKSYIGENRLQIVNFDLSLVKLFEQDIIKENIIFDPNDTLYKISKKNKSVNGSNNLSINEKYINKIKKNINEKQSNSLNRYLNIYYTLVDYYKILIANKNEDMIEKFYSKLLSSAPSHIVELHNEAIMCSLLKQEKNENRFLSDEDIKLYKKIINKK